MGWGGPADEPDAGALAAAAPYFAQVLGFAVQPPERSGALSALVLLGVRAATAGAPRRVPATATSPAG